MTDYSTVSGGVRQGCSLSPFLFILSVELLALKIRQEPNCKGIRLPNLQEAKISQVADDTSLISKKGYPTNLFLTLSVPHRNLAGWQNIRCSIKMAGKFLIVRGFGWELLTFLAFQAELAEKL